jgi:ABC-type multidrug transport system fused ATPase/permease subunit
MFGFSSSIGFYANSATYALGAYLIKNDLFSMTFENLMIVFSCLLFCAQSAGQALSMMPDYEKAKTAAIKLFKLFDKKPNVNNWESDSKETIKEQLFDPSIELDSVEFRYPLRPDACILQNFSLKVNRGQKIALVGLSGCGKSTIMQLLERFYDCERGEVRVSNLDIKRADIHWLRSKIGIVTQEPILFDCTIEENISYGDNDREILREEVIAAAKQANIHEFILNLPQVRLLNSRN